MGFGVSTINQVDQKKTKMLIMVDTKSPRRIGKIADILSNPELELHMTTTLGQMEM